MNRLKRYQIINNANTVGFVWAFDPQHAKEQAVNKGYINFEIKLSKV